ncbi:MAG: DUF4034 domain-containing protein, partial [Pseudomonadota bacterium]
GSEIDIDNVVSIVANPDPTYKEYLDEWVVGMPDVYTSYLIRGTYYLRIAWAKRGEDYSSETTKAQFEGMREAQAVALQDIKKAIELNPKLTVAYSKLISIYSTSGSRKKKFDTLNQALTMNPASYIVRRDMLYFLLPRWGGSYSAIEEFLKDTEQYINDNKELAPLMGYLDYAKAWDTYSNKDYDETIKYTTAALKKGNKSFYYKKRAHAYYSLKDFESAIKDYSNAISVHKYNSDFFIWRAKAYKKIEQPELALKDFQFAAILSPYDYSVRKHYAKELVSNKRYDEAINSFKIALYYNHNDEDVLFRIASTYVRDLKQYDNALPFLKRLIEIDSEKAAYWYQYISALNSLRDCKVMDAIEKYLSLCSAPGDCFDDGVEWAEQTYDYLKRTYCK